MATQQPVERPLSPHIQIYRREFNMLVSILTRITGNALIVSAMMIVWWLLAASTSERYFAVANGFITSWFGQLIWALSVLGIWYHYLAGLRHLYFDAGHGLDMETADKLGWVCLIGSVILTLITLLIV